MTGVIHLSQYTCCTDGKYLQSMEGKFKLRKLLLLHTAGWDRVCQHKGAFISLTLLAAVPVACAFQEVRLDNHRFEGRKNASGVQ